MLFPYKYIADHNMEKMHKCIDYIFNKVWCKAETSEYSLDLFNDDSDLEIIMGQLFAQDLAGKLRDNSASKYFYEGVNEIFTEFKKLSRLEIQKYKDYFRMNNEIANLCSGSTSCSPTLYSDLDARNRLLNDKIETFFTKLYSSGFFDLVDVKKQIGTNLKDYYKDFVRKNDDDVCPFCGLLPLDNEYDPTREAFDHYLPKSKYPFNSVNLKNLAPSCNKCNSGNKQNQDPLHNKQGVRRKAFNPFSADIPQINITVHFQKSSWDKLDDSLITIETKSPSHQEEVDTWVELFRIHKRYIARCCSKSGGQNWLNRIFNESLNYNMTIDEMLEAEIASARTSPWTDVNFLKKAFLEGCKQAGIFAALPRSASVTS